MDEIVKVLLSLGFVRGESRRCFNRGEISCRVCGNRHLRVEVWRPYGRSMSLYHEVTAVCCALHRRGIKASSHVAD